MKNYQSNNILVTGGAGFIGANFIHHILNQPNPPHIVNLDALTYAGSLDNLKNIPTSRHYKFIQGNICNRSLVDTILHNHNIDTIIHFAAESHVDRSITGPSEFIQTNIIGTFTLLEAARHFWLEEKHLSAQTCLFHHISTDEVFGSLENTTDPAFNEETPYAPNSPYSASKASSDHLVRAYFHTYSLPVVTTNCSNNYGPFQHDEKFIPTVIRSCINKTPIPVYGNGSNIRDWLYVLDHCRGIVHVAQHGTRGETYNIGGNNEWTNIDIVKKICELFDKKCPWTAPHETLIKFVTDRPGHDWRYAIDSQKINKTLNWQPQETFETGIVKTIEFYLEKFRISQKETVIVDNA
ncbi:MAG: dTDP-glucose 4,6-dehydratase [Gammaproteobacteria bacterium RIFCSPHIGHO2_02_FULL_42_13]|nr:MAG: dTDP-glucose 4,6-dehydratase [Gammaproteobacteria bacterium RIFCSPHIGHO2_02_FULL_42_13]OGT71148.1 MAG: dTDP-glucose 4,6-dehydratase [Gammaproteobacteria bacterium RIFCSPLOWO2_02_FULL_42_9]